MIDPPFQVRTAGSLRDQPGHASPGTRSGDCLIAVIGAGHGTYRVGERHWRLTAGSIIVPDPKLPGVVASDEDQPYQYAWCRFAGNYARLLVASLADRPVLSHPRWREAWRVLQRMQPLQSDRLPRRMGEREAHLAMLLTILADDAPPRAPGMTVSALESWIADHLADPFDLRAMASDFAMTATSLCRACRRLTGETPQHLAQQHKLAVAIELLGDTDRPVAAIAKRCGYTDPRYFSRIFKRAFGVTPRLWRNTHADGERVLIV